MSTKNKKQNEDVDAKDYEALGRAMAHVYESGYITSARSYRYAFIKGLFTGLGSVLGATLLVALLLWLLSLFGEVPLIGNFVESLRQTVKTRT